MILDSADFVWRAFVMFARLIDHRCGQQLRRIEFADRETFEPCLLTAREALKLRPPDVPQLDVGAVRAALANRMTAIGQV
jgi:hypothetical protein